MNIAFHSNQLGLRGTEVALFEYAFYARKFLGINPIIVSNKHSDLGALGKFQSQFNVYLYSDFSELRSLVDRNRIDAVYYQKSGQFDGKMVDNTKNYVHAVFQVREPHGTQYAYISEWLANKMGWPHFVPYMVDITSHQNEYIDLREQLGIPKTDIVFGYHGGRDSFNVPWVKDIVLEVAKRRTDIQFLFMNVDAFGEHMDNITFLEGTHVMQEKLAFINTCDAMLHARNGGESFGLSVAEFSSLNKPVFTTDWSTFHLNDLAHLHMLGDKAFLYQPDTLRDMLLNVSHSDLVGDWNAYKNFTPEAVMLKFKEVFLDI